MPNMFSRRRGSSVTAPVDRNTSSAAATAASAAFIARSQSQTGLSSAAAAAALRSHTTTPEPVGNVQTKRMVRRGSQTSIGSASVVGSGARSGFGRGGLRRNSSSGSMTERTFRSPSPGRNNGPVSAAPEAPPVPALPTKVRGGHTRSASTEPPQRIMSPTPHGKSRGMSVDRAGSAAANSGRKLATLPDVQEVERQGSNGSVNFSRPISAQGHSPTAGSSPGKANGSWFSGPVGTLTEKPEPTRPATSDSVRAQNTNSIQHDISSAANKPTTKKQFANNAQGSHLSRANEQFVSSADDMVPVMVYDPASRTFLTKSRPVERAQEPPPPVYPKPEAPKPGEYDPNTRTIVPALPPQQPSIVVSGGDTPARRTKPNLPAVDTQMAPPPRNPARDDLSLSPVSPRAAGVLQKQPSVVREDPEGELEAEGTGKTRTYTRPSNGYSKSPVRPASIAITPKGSSNRSESLDVPRSGSDGSTRRRGSSNSPSRSAHFSATPILPNTRHDPPERGISPVKSAMKHSPSSSIRTGSPMALATSPVRKAMSETSETPSIDSSGGKKKKSVRVSFTEQPQEIEAPETPSSRSVGMREVSPIVDDDMDEIMKPRPALPSFGSVRPTRMPQEVAEKVTERPPDRHEISNDHAIGAVLAKNAVDTHHEKHADHDNEPMPPEVTSRDGPTYSSDESEDEGVSELDAAGATAKAVASQVIGRPPPLEIKDEKKQEEEHVPEISLQPPTPGEEEKHLEEPPRSESPPARSSLERFVVPGGWTAEPDEDDAPVAAPATVSAVQADTEDKVQPVQDKPFVAPISTADPFIQVSEDEANVPQLSDIAESDSDDSAIFSDAAEDLSDLEDGGFASLDAIVESPMAKPKKDPNPESPSARQAAKRTSKEEARPVPTDWSHATSYWKQLSKQQRDQIERSHFSSDDEYAQASNALANRPKKKSALKKNTSADRVDTVMNPPAPKPAPAPAQKERTAMRKSMRAPAEPTPAPTNGVQMRSSLREGGGGGMRSSMRDRPQSDYIPSKPAQRQNVRPKSAGGSSMPTAAAGGAMSRTQQSPELPSQDGPFPRMQPSAENLTASSKLAKKLPPPAVPADDSDSESSFKKKRRPSQSNTDASGRYAMRRSLRAMSMDSEQRRPVSPQPTAKERKAFSVRSLSPSGSFFGGRKQLKESMRAAPVENNAKTLRGPNSMRNTNSKPSSKAPSNPRAKPAAGGMASKFKSRFADSDDEDERPQGQKSSFFRSRFADSDDDEPASRTVIPADLTPVRGIPRRRGQEDGDSTDLSDEEDEDPRKTSRRRTKQTKPIVPDSADVEKAMAAARRNLGMTNGTNGSAAPAANEGSALSKGSLRKPEPETHPIAANEETRPLPPPPLPINNATKPGSPRAGKLQRRTSAQDNDYFGKLPPKSKLATEDANWPLVLPTHPTDSRPNTSDGLSRHEQAVRLARSMRPDIGRSWSNSEGVDPGSGGGAVHVGFADDVKHEDGGKGVYSAKTGKKKKFGMLRKAFGLND
ncbi:hypothetical protein Q7P37_009518 [Cladosporium fusiforme]